MQNQMREDSHVGFKKKILEPQVDRAMKSTVFFTKIVLELLNRETAASLGETH